MSDVLVRFAHITDTHITPGDRQERNFANYSPAVMALIEEAMRHRGAEEPTPIPGSLAARQLVDEINRLPFSLDFVLHTGDIMTDPHTADEYTAVQELLGAIKYPVHYLRGNHDNLEGIQRVLMGRDEAALTPTLDYSFLCNGVQIVVVDSATNGVDHGGRLSEAQLAWLEGQVTGDTSPLVVAIHHHVVAFGSRFLDFFGTSNGDAIHQVLRKAGSRLRGVFSGHIHQAIDIYRDGILYSFAPNNNVSSNLWPGATPDGSTRPAGLPGFSMVTVTTTHTFVRRYSYPLPTA